jgi:hypothetical protein
MGDDGGGLVAAKNSFALDPEADCRTPRSPLLEKLESRVLLSAVAASSSVPFLTDTFLTQLPSAALPRAQGTVGLRITDDGPGPADGNFQISLLATTDGTIAGTVATVKTFTERLDLVGGGHSDSTIGFVYPSDLPAGTYQFIATVNFRGTVSQTHASYQQVTIAPPFVDLSAYFTQAPPFVTIDRIPPEGLALLVKNSGNKPATGKITVSVYESPTQTLGASPNLLETFSNVPIDIKANGIERVTLVQKKIPLTAVAGSQYLVAVLSSNTTPLQSTVAAPFPTSFSTAQFVALPGTITIGHSIAISLLVTNAQATAVRGRVNISLYQSTSSSLGSSSVLLQTFSNLPINIPVNGSQTYTLNLKVPPTADVGDHFLISTLSPIAPLAANQTTDSTISSLNRRKLPAPRIRYSHQGTAPAAKMARHNSEKDVRCP